MTLKNILSVLFVVIAVACKSVSSTAGNVDTNEIKDSNKQYDPLLAWEAPFEIQRNYPYYLGGYDKESRPIWYSEFGKWDVKRVVEQGGEMLQDLDKWMDQALLRINSSLTVNTTKETPIKKFIIVCDLEAYSVQQLTSIPTVQFLMRVTIKAARILAPHLHHGYLINSNVFFETLFNMIRPALGSMADKIDMYGTNPTRWKPVLLKNLPKDQIPTWYGGTLEPKHFVHLYG